MGVFQRVVALIASVSLLAAHFPLPVFPEPRTQAPCTIRASVQISPEAGGSLELDGLSLEVPAGAVEKPIRISVTRLAAVTPLQHSLLNATDGAVGYRFEPHGLNFHRMVRVTMPFNPNLLASESALSNLFTYFYNGEWQRWERLDREAIDRDRARVTSRINHFSDLVTATLQLPEGPAPIQFDANAIKKLSAAKPDEGVPLPEGMGPGPFGEASFRIPLRLPPGRAGAVPALALQYSSTAANSWLGRGFDITVPAISIDTRFGLPRYDGSDRMMLNGEELVQTGVEGAAQTYRSRTERHFQRIRRFQEPGEHYWEVTSKNGETSEYGRGESWLGPNRSRREQSFLWNLSKSRDPFGNTVEYNYWYDEDNHWAYLSEIRYSGFEGVGSAEAGAFRVAFLLEDRPDRRSTARGRFVSTLAKRLRRVEIYWGNERVRAFAFTYRATEFGQSVLRSFAEEDGTGQLFYTYDFEYHGLTERRNANGELEGYEGFEPEKAWDKAGDRSHGLNDTRTVSAGGSLYAGVELFIWVPFLGRIPLAQFGLSGGLSFSSSASRASLLDINGDGLPDVAWKEGRELVGYLNRGDGFDSSRLFRLAGLDGPLEQETQSSFSLGLSAGLWPLQGALTRQRSWVEAKTAFSDINGDGFLDFIQEGGFSFARHTGSSFAGTAWRSEGGTVRASSISTDPDADNYRRVYFAREPLRQWKAYRAGNLQVLQTARLLRPEAAGPEGILLHTHRGEATDTLVLDREHAEASHTGQYAVAANESLYFHLAGGGEPPGDGVEWNVRLRYIDIDYFAGLAESALFQPLTRSEGERPYGGDARLQPIYTESQQSVGGSPVKVFTLINDWQSLPKSVLEPACAALIEHGAFVPRRLTKPVFERIFAEAQARGTETLPMANPQGGVVDVPLSRLLLEGYGYEPENQVFVRLNSSGDEACKRCLVVLSPEERRLIGLFRWLDGTWIVPRFDASYTAQAPPRVVPPALMSADVRSTAAVGETLVEAGLLLDAVWSDATEQQPLERWWLRRDAGGQWRMHREDALGLEHPTTASFTGQDPLTVRIGDRGVERGFTVSGKSSLLTRIPAAVFESTVSAAILAGESFSPAGGAVIPQASWAPLLAKLSAEERAQISACYRFQDAEYILLENLSEEDTIRVLSILDRATALPGSLFGTLPDDPGASRCLILLSGSEYASFASDDALSGLFRSNAEGSRYYLRRDLNSGDRALLVAAMRTYRRDVELFPFFEKNTEAAEFYLKPGLSPAAEEKIRHTLAACGLEVWTRIDRSLTYRAGEKIPVHPAVLPSGATEETFTPFSALVTSPGQDTGRVEIPVFDLLGGTRLATRYIHVFDSGADFSTENLVAVPEEYRFADPQEVLGGGVCGWFYGSWTGYYPWNQGRLSVESAEPVPQEPGKAAPPPFFEAMRPNTETGSPVVVSLVGGGQEALSNAWLGSVSAYSDAGLDDSGIPVFTEKKFAAFVAGDRLQPCRNGGDAYYRIPRNSGSAGGTLWSSSALPAAARMTRMGASG